MPQRAGSGRSRTGALRRFCRAGLSCAIDFRQWQKLHLVLTLPAPQIELDGEIFTLLTFAAHVKSLVHLQKPTDVDINTIAGIKGGFDSKPLLLQAWGVRGAGKRSDRKRAARAGSEAAQGQGQRSKD